MTSFCPNCYNLLVVNTTSDALKFECPSCHTSVDGTAEDTLRYEEVEGSDITTYQKQLQKAADDPVGHKIRVTCPACSHGIARDIIVGDDMKVIYTCLKCRHQWFGTSETRT